MPTEPLNYLTSCPAPQMLPDHWEYIDFAPAGIYTGCVRAHAYGGEPQSKITFISGFKSNVIDYNTPQLRALQRAGVEIDIIPLPDPGTEVGYLHDNKAIVREVLAGRTLEGGLKPDIPNYIFGHSLGGRAFIANMLHDDFAEEVVSNYAGAVLIAPHFSSPYRSKPLLNAFYTGYCKVFSDKSYGEAPLDWTWSAIDTVKEKLQKSGLMKSNTAHVFEEKSKVTHSPITRENTATTHGQILYSNIEGEILERRIREEGVPDAAKEFPMVMIGGSKDFVSCKNYIKKVADEFDARFCEFDTYHNPFLESKEARQLIMAAMKEMTDNWNNLNTPESEEEYEYREALAHYQYNKGTGHTYEDLSPDSY